MAKYVFPATEATRKEKVHKPWLERIIKYSEQFGLSNPSLLEIGPGFGTFSSLARESDYFKQVLVIEPTPELATSCRSRGLDVIEKRVEDIDSSLFTKVDIIVAFEVIEHLFNPSIFLEKIRTLLRQDGLLILSCPNGLGFDIATLGSNSLAVDAEHINLFNPISLSLLLSNSGFEVLHTSTPGRLDAEYVREAILSELTNPTFKTYYWIIGKLYWSFKIF